ncbi:hypothetical protein [Burkholderia cepacia]|uniref:hypothetical protein n=1 Tax=Burkholderia cepacia TaxID=292 RepID=UPI000AFFCDBA|nr:hypothetical protein [Burkholderia cepacia]
MEWLVAAYPAASAVEGARCGACVLHACVLDRLGRASIAWRRIVARPGPQAIDARFEDASYPSVAEGIRRGARRAIGIVGAIMYAVQYNS